MAARVAGFEPRACQQEMAGRIEEVIERGGRFIAESGTGTGKTFAYLVPALRSGRKILISTGTKNLQDQLFHRDLPVIRDALARPVSVALLKGRGNYLCLHRLENAAADEADRGGRTAAHLEAVRAWAERTRSGDTAEVQGVPEDSPIWPRVTSTTENCLGSRCGRYEECHVNRARSEALDADVLVINHHLFFADLVLREDGFGRLLPGVDAVIFDEAHQLPEIASSFFGVSVTSRAVVGLCRDAIAEEVRERSGIEGFRAAVDGVQKAVADLRLTAGATERRAAWEEAAGRRGFQDALAELRGRMRTLVTALEHAAKKGEGLAACWRRGSDLSERLALFERDPDADAVRWIETTRHGFAFHITPIDTAPAFRQHLDEVRKAVVFTSATLAIDGRFEFFQSRMGLEDADTACWASPFDFARQCLLYLPPGLPVPGAPEFTDAVVDAALPVLNASRGRAFLLFTSHRALQHAAQRLRPVLDYPLLVQGDAPRNELLGRFRDLGNAVLLGTSSFWEGVDVRGEALSCVIIDKLPFGSPADPVFQARAAAIERSGRSAFKDYQLPAAVIALKQGVGRLIRDANDRGVLVICDPRLRNRGYGRIFLNSLPPAPVTSDVSDVRRFFSADTGA